MMVIEKSVYQTVSEARPGCHTYLGNRGIKNLVGLVDYFGDLIIPMRNLEGGLVGLQRVHWNAQTRIHEKTFEPGMVPGAIFRIGDESVSSPILCSGWLTGMSIAEACHQMRLSIHVICCFTSKNIEFVASRLQNKAMIYADNDMYGDMAAKAAGVPYITAIGHDANDDHSNLGIFYVCKKIMELRKNA